MIKKNTLHIFGGGVFVEYALNIAMKQNWKVVIRTGQRFLDDLDSIEQNKEVKLLSSNSLTEIMDSGGLPASGDVGISFSAPWIIPKNIIEKFNGKIFNLHNQPLPRLRGCGGSSWNILMHEKTLGCTIHQLTPEIDGGDIYASKIFSVPEDFVYPKDYDELIKNKAKELIEEWLPNLLETGDPGTPKDNKDSESDYWPRLNTEIHAWINWSWSIGEIITFCHAFSYPHKGAKTTINEGIINIQEVSEHETNKNFHPYQNGIVYRIDNENLYVAHKDGALKIKKYSKNNEDMKIRLGDRLYTPMKKLEESISRRIQYSPDGEIFDLN